MLEMERNSGQFVQYFHFKHKGKAKDTRCHPKLQPKDVPMGMTGFPEFLSTLLLQHRAEGA